MSYKIGLKYNIFKVKNDYKILFLNNILYLNLKSVKYIINYVTNILILMTRVFSYYVSKSRTALALL